MKRVWKFLWPYLKNKYVITILVYVIWMIFFGQNNLLDQRRLTKELQKLNDDKRYYKEQISTDSIRYQQLTTNDENLEKFAREEYYMKKPNEDIFVIVED